VARVKIRRTAKNRREGATNRIDWTIRADPAAAPEASRGGWLRALVVGVVLAALGLDHPVP
jgi:hypothetical protein